MFIQLQKFGLYSKRLYKLLTSNYNIYFMDVTNMLRIMLYNLYWKFLILLRLIN